MGTNDSSSYQDERVAIKKPVMHIILKTQSSTEGKLLPQISDPNSKVATAREDANKAEQTSQRNFVQNKTSLDNHKSSSKETSNVDLIVQFKNKDMREVLNDQRPTTSYHRIDEVNLPEG